MILVTGGAGYIGSHTAIRLIEKGYDVVIADNFSTSKEERIGDIEKITGRITPYYNADVGNVDDMDRIFSENDIGAVMHFAAYSLVGESMEKPLKYFGNNVCKTEKLLESMIRAGVRNIIFSSSAAVYGETGDKPVTEDAPLCPTNCYGETKMIIEKMLKWAEISGLRHVGLRYFNACGAHKSGLIGEDHNPETHLIPIVLQTAAGKRDKLYIFGNDYPTRDGTCVRDYIHVDDLADAHIAAYEYLRAGGKCDVFNLGNGKGFTVKEILTEARRITGKEIPAEIASRRAGDPAILTASSEKAERILGWKPIYREPSEIIETAWKWHSREMA